MSAGGPSSGPWMDARYARRFGTRASLIGPLLLILLGCAFLITNLWPNLPVWQIAADYWPFLLVVWGALRSLEILYIWQQGRPLPVYGLTGGEWALAIFLTIFGALLFAGHQVGERFSNAEIARRGLRIFGEGFDYPVETSLQAGATPRLLIENFDGNIRAVAAEGDTIQVRGHSTVRAFNQEDANRFHAQSQLELVQENGYVVLRLPRGANVRNQTPLSADLDITLPPGASVETRGRVRGDFDVTGITGNVSIDADNAGVRLNNIGGRVLIDTRRSDVLHLNGVKGDVELRGSGEDLELENMMGEVKIAGFYRGDLSFRSLAKPLRLENRGTELRVDSLTGVIRMDRGDFEADGVTAPLMLRTGSTDVKISRSPGPLDIEVSRGDIDISGAPKANWKLRTSAGDIALALVSGFELRARTGRGEIESDFNELRTEASHGNAELQGSVGRGPLVEVSTGRGNVRIERQETLVLERETQ